MRKILLGVGLFTALFISSCDQEANVAKSYTYTLDEEFLNNDLGWLEDTVSYIPDNTKPDSSLIAYSFSQVSLDNGVFSISADTSSNGQPIATYLDYKEANLSSNNFILETSITWGGEELAKSYAGITWDNVDDNTYKFFGVSVGGDYVIESTPVDSVGSVSIVPSNLVYNLKIEREDKNIYFSINGESVDTLVATDLNSSKIGIYSGSENNVSFHYLRAQVQ